MTLLRKLAAILAACLITSPAWGQTLSTPGAGLSTSNTYTGTNIFTSPIQSYTAGDTQSVIAGLGAANSDVTANEGAVIIGWNAGYYNTNPSASVLIGRYSGYNTTSSSLYDVCIGWSTCLGNAAGTTGSLNVAIGMQALASPNDTNARASVCVGYQTCIAATTTALSTIVGFQSGNGLTSGQDDTIVGASAGQGIAASNYNTFVGWAAGGSNVTGADNTIIGAAVGNSVLTTGTGNVLIGTTSATTTVAAGTTNEINIDQGYINFATAPTITTGQALGTTPTITANSSHVFKAVVGATPTGTTETIGLPTAPTGWFCTAWDITTSANTAKQTASSATGATMTWSGAPTASDVILHNCDAY